MPVKQGVYKIVQRFKKFGGEGGFQFFVQLVLFFVESLVVFSQRKSDFSTPQVSHKNMAFMKSFTSFLLEFYFQFPTNYPTSEEETFGVFYGANFPIKFCNF